MTHYLTMILVLIIISAADARTMLQKQLTKELYVYSAFALFIIVYGYLYFSYMLDVSISEFFNELIVNK